MFNRNMYFLKLFFYYFCDLYWRIRYAFDDSKADKEDCESYWRRWKCRFGGHKCGVVWYNPGGFEPDMHCKNCGEDLG